MWLPSWRPEGLEQNLSLVSVLPCFNMAVFVSCVCHWKWFMGWYCGHLLWHISMPVLQNCSTSSGFHWHVMICLLTRLLPHFTYKDSGDTRRFCICTLGTWLFELSSGSVRDLLTGASAEFFKAKLNLTGDVSDCQPAFNTFLTFF